jgi:hypothetical protein
MVGGDTVWRVCVVGMDQFFGFRTNFCSFSKGLTCLYFSSGQIFFSHASKQTYWGKKNTDIALGVFPVLHMSKNK